MLLLGMCIYICWFKLISFLGFGLYFVCLFARGAEKIKLLKSMGVDHVVDIGTENVISSVKAFVKTRKLKGVDVLYDPVGGKLTKESMKVLNWGAQILVIGFASGEVPVIPANIALVKVNDLSCNREEDEEAFHLRGSNLHDLL